jgi:hypothetical protein
MQKLFFAQWLDGPRRYSAQACKGLGPAHAGLPITPAHTGKGMVTGRVRGPRAPCALDARHCTLVTEQNVRL